MEYLDKEGLKYYNDKVDLKITDKVYDIIKADYNGLAGLMDVLSYGVEWDITENTLDCKRVGNLSLHRNLPIQNSLKGVLKNGLGFNYLDPSDWTKLADGTSAKLDGSMGDVMVHYMKFYGKSFESVNGDTNKKQVRISEYKIDDTWTEIPEGMVSAYYMAVDASDSKAPLGRSIVNFTSACRGGNGNRSNLDQYYTEGTSVVDFRTDLGKPRTWLSRAQARLYAKNNGVELLDYETYKWIMWWLPVIEYATFDIQKEYTDELDAGGFHLGGLGPGVTTVNFSNESKYNGNYPLVQCGYTNEFGNFSGVKTYTFPIIDGVTNPAESMLICRYRGIEQPYGDIAIFLDGCILMPNGDTINCYLTKDPNKYSDTDYENMDIIRVIPAPSRLAGWVSSFYMGDSADIFPDMSVRHAKNICYYEYNKDVEKMLINAGFFCNQGKSSVPASLQLKRPTNFYNGVCAYNGFRIHSAV